MAADDTHGPMTPFGFGEPVSAPPAEFVPTARIPPLMQVAWRDETSSPWRYGSTGRSERPPGGEEVVEVYEYATGAMLRFVGDEIERLWPKPIVKGSGGRSTKRIG